MTLTVDHVERRNLPNRSADTAGSYQVVAHVTSDQVGDFTITFTVNLSSQVVVVEKVTANRRSRLARVADPQRFGPRVGPEWVTNFITAMSKEDAS